MNEALPIAMKAAFLCLGYLKRDIDTLEDVLFVFRGVPLQATHGPPVLAFEVAYLCLYHRYLTNPIHQHRDSPSHALERKQANPSRHRSPVSCAHNSCQGGD